MAAVDDQLIQLTWREGVGYRYDLNSLSLLSTFPYPAEGWGMCYDGAHLYTSDGSPFITVRDADSLADHPANQVSLNSGLVSQINELECVGNSIYANVWHADTIMRIDKATGVITAVIDASGLLTPEQRASMSLRSGAERYRIRPGQRHLPADGEAVAVVVRSAVRPRELIGFARHQGWATS